MKRSILRAVGVAAVLVLSGACSTAGPDDVDLGITQQAFAPGVNGPGTITVAGTLVNFYAPVTANIAAASRTVSVTDVTTLGANFGPGSLIMVMQMQGANINATNTAAYGNVTELRGAGTFEFVHVESVQGNTITVENACGGFKNAYALAGHVQVIRVPEYSTLTINNNASIIGLPWNGSRGGVVAVRVAGATTFNGTGLIDVSGMGFRGGAIEQNTSLPGAAATLLRSALDTDGAQKGESIAGFTTEYNATFNGAFGRGAPANGGGGGNAHNGGGGGGANAGALAMWNGNGIMTGNYPGANMDPWRLDAAFVANGNARTTSTGGGRGGYSYSANDINAVTQAPGVAGWGGDNRREVGGLGGHPIVSGPTAAATRYFLGGGGGAGDSNNNAATAGGSGGGFVFVESDTIVGNGTIRANGSAAGNTVAGGNDAPGGGGGGGSIVIVTTAIPAGFTLAANGAAGGNQIIAGNEAEGPGGGGGGGYIAVSGTPTRTANGGANGTTNSAALTEFVENGATRGAPGDAAATALTAAQLAALSCYANNAPVNTAPATRTVAEDTTLAFTAGNAISIRDIDALTNPVQVTLTATNGTVTLAGLAGLTFSTGDGTADATMTFTGTIAAINAALLTLTYTPNPNFNGAATLTITTNDQGNTSSPSAPATDTDVIAITVTPVNDAPIANADTAAATVGTPVDIDVLANDTDPDGIPPTVLTITAVSVPSQGTAAIVGGKVRYTPALNGSGTATFTYTVSDGTTTAVGSVSVTVGGGTDTDKDGLPDAFEIAIGTDPNDADSDDDGVKDGDEPSPSVDSDGDGLINALDPDSDNDGLFDGTELGLGCADPATDIKKHHCVADADPTTKTDPLNKDTDGGGKTDGSEDANLNGKVDTGETNPIAGQGADDSGAANADGDNDGLSDNLEKFLGSDPADADSDDDGLLDGEEANPSDDTDDDGAKNVVDADSDNDGLFDGLELSKACSNPATDNTKKRCTVDVDPTTKTSPLLKDTDKGGVMDGVEDVNRDGKLDAGEKNPVAGQGADDLPLPIDTDKDGLPDAFEVLIGTDPNDADSDDDGVLDGQEPNPTEDSDGDGLINPLDPDSDNDGLLDGTEMGRDCSNTATDKAKNNCIADADPATRTNPLDRDTDKGGASDGSEDVNLNGKLDPGEKDPTYGHGADDSSVTDTDKDGLGDDLEKALGSNPNDADTDDDGVIDGLEPNPSLDTDGDGLKNVIDADSDNDGLFDGTEMGKDCSNAATDNTKKKCTADADPVTRTSPLLKDTDKGGIIDGNEDVNRNGKVDTGETNPNPGNGADDKTAPNLDTDGDGLTDAFEDAIGSNKNDVDSDDDGVRDGLEPNPAEDTDGDGKANVNDPDSDGDGLFDGTEMGLGCDANGTDKSKNQCIPDADPATKTNMLDPDTDKGGVTDGMEDTNHNGKVDTGERDPLVKDDDNKTGGTGCTKDADCGAVTSGQVCNIPDGGSGTCGPGCRGAKGNTCPTGQSCSSSTEIAGVCSAGPIGAPDGGPSVPGTTPVDDGGSLEGGGVSCSTAPGTAASSTAWMLGIGLALTYGLRRRRRTPRI